MNDINSLTDNQKHLLCMLRDKDYETYIHSLRVKDLTNDMINIMNAFAVTDYSKKDRMIICKGAILHDIGKLYIDSGVLKKADVLSDDEMRHMSQHTRLGYEAIKNELSDDEHEVIKNICLYHHERLDGRGYEKKAELPMYIQIVSVCDVFDALHSDRIYRKGLNKDECFAIIRGRGRGGAFGGMLVDFLEKVVCDI
ncbi:MAG: HD domain-containing protein [Clostridia bacterium]|nr:HD domain-containing protein [Clostridia bacterium]